MPGPRRRAAGADTAGPTIPEEAGKAAKTREAGETREAVRRSDRRGGAVRTAHAAGEPERVGGPGVGGHQGRRVTSAPSRATREPAGPPRRRPVPSCCCAEEPVRSVVTAHLSSARRRRAWVVRVRFPGGRRTPGGTSGRRTPRGTSGRRRSGGTSFGKGRRPETLVRQAFTGAPDGQRSAGGGTGGGVGRCRELRDAVGCRTLRVRWAWQGRTTGGVPRGARG